MSANGTYTTFMLGEWHVDPALKQIVRANEVVKIDPRNMRVLLLLASRSGEVVSQSEIEDSVWKGLVVTPNSVYQSVAQLRRAFGEGKSNRRYIETISRKGYRLVVPVCAHTPVTTIADLREKSLSASGVATTTTASSDSDGGDGASQQPIASKLFLRRLTAASLTVIAVATLVAVAISQLSTRSPLRSENEASRAASDETAKRAQLAIQMDSPPDTAHLEPLPEALQFDVSYKRSIESLNQLLASQSAQGSNENLGTASTYLRLATLYLLCSEPLKSERSARRGLAILTKQNSELSPEGITLNAKLAEALADTERYPEAERYLMRSLDLAKQLNGDANYDAISKIDQMALLRLAENRFAEAEHEARRAIELYRLVPNASANRTAYLVSTLSWALNEQGLFAEAITESLAAIEAIKPDDPPATYLKAYAHHFLGDALNGAGRYSEAAAELRIELALFATIPHVRMDTARAQSSLAEALMNTGHLTEAEALLTKAHRTLAIGDGWRERKARRDTNARMQQLQLAKARITAAKNLTAKS